MTKIISSDNRSWVYKTFSFILDISIVPRLFKSTTTQRCSRLHHWCSVMELTYRSAIGNCEWRNCQSPKVLTWRLEWDLNLRSSGRKALNLPLSHHLSRSGVNQTNYLHKYTFLLWWLALGYYLYCFMVNLTTSLTGLGNSVWILRKPENWPPRDDHVCRPGPEQQEQMVAGIHQASV